MGSSMMFDPATPIRLPDRVLDPLERISEILFGLIMALTFTCTLGVATADHLEVRTMLIGALGCNLAWGIIDGSVYLLARFNERGRAIIDWRAVRDAADVNEVQRGVADIMPLASTLAPEHLQSIQPKLRELPEPPHPQLAKSGWLRGVAIWLLSFLSTLPILIPFLAIADARLALRVSNAIAIAMLLLCGVMLGRFAGFQPMVMGLSMVAFGAALVAVAIALGG